MEDLQNSKSHKRIVKAIRGDARIIESFDQNTYLNSAKCNTF